MSDSSSVVIDANFVSWPKHMHPGHCFMWSQPIENTRFYSIVLQTKPEQRKVGFRLTRTFGPPHPYGLITHVPEDVAIILLSTEQMELARRLNWPQDEDSLREICAVPPS
jgi:hypothetical protein